MVDVLKWPKSNPKIKRLATFGTKLMVYCAPSWAGDHALLKIVYVCFFLVYVLQVIHSWKKKNVGAMFGGWTCKLCVWFLFFMSPFGNVVPIGGLDCWWIMCCGYLMNGISSSRGRVLFHNTKEELSFLWLHCVFK